MVGAGTREGRVGSLGQGLNLKAGGSIELTKMTGIKPTFQGVAFPTDEEILEESLDNTNNGTGGGGGGIAPPTEPETGQGRTGLGMREQETPTQLGVMGLGDQGSQTNQGGGWYRFRQGVWWGTPPRGPDKEPKRS